MQKNIVIGILVCVGVAGGFVWLQKSSLPSSTPQQGSSVSVGGHHVQVEIARTPEEHARGLMDRRVLGEDAGMLFLFEHSEPRQFWNKNTLIPLDIIWIYRGHVVGIDALPSEDAGLVILSSPGTVEAALEVNHGWTERRGIKVGDLVAL